MIDARSELFSYQHCSLRRLTAAGSGSGGHNKKFMARKTRDQELLMNIQKNWRVMKYSYRITKYEYLNDPQPHHYGDWTSFHDIGTQVPEAEYLLVESTYIETLIAICRYLKATSLVVHGLESFSDAEPYKEGQVINLEEISFIVRAILREEIWCKLKSVQCEFHFGYDYYMYLVCDTDMDRYFSKVNSLLVFEKYRSPYSNN